MSKEAIIHDEGKFQRACSRFVERNVLYCVSNLMYSVGQNLEAGAKIFDFDFDEALGWFGQDDWEEPVDDFIRIAASFYELENIAEMCGYWSDVLAELGFPEDGAPEDYCEAYPEKEAELRQSVLRLVTSPDLYREIGQEYNLEPYNREVFEHWLVDSWFAGQLRERGEVVFEFCDMTVWGRTTTGQAIAMDGVIREMVRSLPDYSYVWED